MNFEIEAETFLRLAGVSKIMPANVSEADGENLRCVRLEYRSGVYYAVASNRKVAAIYMLGETNEPDCAVHITIDKVLLDVCVKEKPFNSKLFITAIPEIGAISVKTSLGYNYPGNGGTFDAASKLADWPNWAPKEPITATSGPMVWPQSMVMLMSSAAPSGQIVFPEFIDAMKPVILRDENNPNWCGLFMPNLMDDNGKVYVSKPAVLPKWWIKK